MKMALLQESKTMTIHEIADLITVRNFIALSIDNLNVRLSREEVKAVQTKVAQFDKLIIENSLKVDPSKSVQERSTITRSFESTEPVEAVANRVAPMPDMEEKPAGKVRRSKSEADEIE
jgi:hypothetical protein